MTLLCAILIYIFVLDIIASLGVGASGVSIAPKVSIASRFSRASKVSRISLTSKVVRGHGYDIRAGRDPAFGMIMLDTLY